MKKLMIVSLAIALLTPVIALAASVRQDQDQPKQSDTRTQAMNVPGKISQDGETFVSDADGKTWTIANPEAIKGHEGHHVVLQAKIDVGKNEVRVLAVKMLKESNNDYNNTPK
jgi:hypothetical protein